MLYLLLLEPLLRCLANRVKGDTRHSLPCLVQACCDDLLLMVNTLSQFLEYAAVIGRYKADMGMSLNVCKCACTTMHTEVDHEGNPDIHQRTYLLLPQSTGP